MSSWSFSTDHVASNAFSQWSRSESKLTWAQYRSMYFISVFSAQHERCLFFFFRCRWNFLCSISDRAWFAHETKTTFVENRWFMNNCCFVRVCLSSLEIFWCIWDRFWFALNLFVILSHFLRIIDDMSLTRMRYRACDCSWFKCKSMRATYVSISRIETNVTRKISKMFRRHLFCMTASLLMIFVFFVLNMYQIAVS